ncbi:MAG: uroporphyrinogen decarboxylase family protein [Planctomycetota bacterium]
MSMDSRERAFLALNHQKPDRIPIDFWASVGFKAKLEKATQTTFLAFQDKHDVDLRYIAGPKYIGPPLIVEGRDSDIWGVPRRTVEIACDNATEYYDEVVSSPLTDAESVAAVIAYAHWPSPDWFDYSVIKEQCEEIQRQGRVVVFMGDRLNRIAQLKPAMYLAGMDQIMIHMAINPEVAVAIFGQVRNFYIEYTRRILESARGKIDIVCTGDDFGGQNSLLISPCMWRDFLREGFKAYIDLIHSAGVKVMHHTCGSVALLIPSMIECGLDILQSLQPEAAGMVPAAIKKQYGRDLCFHGGISIQQTMPKGTASDIRRDVKAAAETLGRDGGYIFCTAHNIQADTPVANAETLLKAYHEFGRYD